MDILAKKIVYIHVEMKTFYFSIYTALASTTRLNLSVTGLREARMVLGEILSQQCFNLALNDVRLW